MNHLTSQSTSENSTFRHDGKLAQAPPDVVQRIAVSLIKPSRENDGLYSRFDSSDRQNQKLIADVRENGVRNPLILTRDHFIISGHRRYNAARYAGLKVVPCLFEDVSRSELTTDEFIVLLRRHNLNRDKTITEQMREAIVDTSPARAHRSLIEAREERELESQSAAFIEIIGTVKRSQISSVKEEMAKAVLNAVEERREFWPLSVRSIHYALLNDPPLFNCGKNLKLRKYYQNDRNCYSDLTDLALRLRLAGRLDWNAINDDTRPFDLPRLDKTPASYFEREYHWLLRGYRRNLLQSQPHHIEIIGEKNTVRNVLKPVADQYTIPLTTARGFSSATPRLDVSERYKKSGKSKLIVLALTDFDPCGEEIAHSFARSLRDDFGVRNVELLKVALTEEQVERFNLPIGATAKKSDKKSAKFTAKYGANVWELEALPMPTLQSELQNAIDTVLDIKAFNQELEAEKRDAVEIDQKRQLAILALKSETE